MEITGSKVAEMLSLTRQAVFIAASKGVLEKSLCGKYDINDKKNIQYFLTHGITHAAAKKWVGINVKKKALKPAKSKQVQVRPPKKKVIVKKKAVKSNGPKKTIIIEKDHFVDVSKKVEPVIEKNNPLPGPVEKAMNANEKFEDMTGLPAKMMKISMKTLVLKYGGAMQLKNWADILNKLMTASEKELKMAERRIELIDKDFVIARLFSYLETLSQQLFDYPESEVDNVIALAMADGKKTRITIIDNMKKSLGIIIQETKNNINRELDGLVSKHRKNDAEELQ